MFPFKSQLTNRLAIISRLLNIKHVHTTTIICSDYKKETKKFSFIEVKSNLTNKYSKQRALPDEETDMRSVINDLLKQQESIASKLAKLIDKLEPNKTAEKLLEPVNEIKKSKQIPKSEEHKEHKDQLYEHKPAEIVSNKNFNKETNHSKKRK